MNYAIKKYKRRSWHEFKPSIEDIRHFTTWTVHLLPLFCAFNRGGNQHLGISVSFLLPANYWLKPANSLLSKFNLWRRSMWHMPKPIHHGHRLKKVSSSEILEALAISHQMYQEVDNLLYVANYFFDHSHIENEEEEWEVLPLTFLQEKIPRVYQQLACQEQ